MNVEVNVEMNAKMDAKLPFSLNRGEIGGGREYIYTALVTGR